MKSDKKYSAIILSAGNSSRMGVPKFSLRFDKTTTFLENLINQYNAFGCEEIIVVLNPDGVVALEQLKIRLSSNTKVIINNHPEWERFYSMKLGARNLEETNSVFVSNIDNPFVNQSLLISLSEGSNEVDYVYPAHNGRGGHPFLLSVKVVTDLISEEKDQIHLKEFLSKYTKKSVDVDDDKILLNINTEDEYKRIFA
jgi:molybdenum cofactor cytidylyltransferase